MQGAEARGVRGRAREQQSGHDHDRSGIRRPYLHRTVDGGHSARDHPAGTARRTAADPRRPDRAEPRDGLEKRGILERYQIELIGATASDRARRGPPALQQCMLGIGLDLPRSGSAHSMSEAQAVASTIGSWPLIIRPGFTLGGTGGGIAHDQQEFEEIVRRGLDASMNSEVLIEESLLGWKEFEMEVMRDKAGNRGHRLLDRESRSDGRPHGGLDHDRADPDPHRPRIPGHARRLTRGDGGDRRRNRRLERAVGRESGKRAADHHRDDPRVLRGRAPSPPRRPGFRSRRSRTARGRVHAR